MTHYLYKRIFTFNGCHFRLHRTELGYTRYRHASSRSWSSNDVRSTFIEFFKKRDHLFIPSSSVIPKKNDGSYFVNAGMNQFKPLFLGTVDPQSEMSSYKRVVNSQKCIRVGGKHNDLDEVGHDTYHHTFFEMLGNWSFADYSKREACAMAWELLTKVYQLPASQLYVTYFGGNKDQSLEPDAECLDIWRSIGVPLQRLSPFGMKDNFWVMGETGPCGPCTEIHFDHLARPDATSLVNSGSPDVIELWNLVFIQFDRQKDGGLRKLPRSHVDTGMGLERMTAVLQGKKSNYDTDLFKPIFDAISNACQCPSYVGRSTDPLDVAYRIVADHARMFTVALSDGLLPGRKDSEAKLRQIIYRCVHQATQVLGAPPGFISSLVPVVASVLGEAFPELMKNHKELREVIDQTEQRYLNSLIVGRKMVSKALNEYGSVGCLSGQQILEIQDGKFGKVVPVDVICAVAGDLGISINLEEFEQIIQQQKDFNKANATNDRTDNRRLDQYDVQFLKERNIPTTDDHFKYDYASTSDGFGFPAISAKILALKYDGKMVDRVDAGCECGVVLDKTCFYSEAGGQVADLGQFETNQDSVASVLDVSSNNNYVLHTVQLEGRSICVGDHVELKINMERRIGCMANHTATHILNFALNKVLGGVRQQGSLVNDSSLSFSFTSLKATVTSDDIIEISRVANEIVGRKCAVHRTTLPLKDSKRIPNLVTLIDEFYPENVHVISIGKSVEELVGSDEGSPATSVELCAGTHVDNVEQLDAIVITKFEGSVQGTKRVVAVTRQLAKQAIENAKELHEQLDKLSNDADINREEIIKKIETSLADFLLPKVDREIIQTRLAQILHKLDVGRARNRSKLSHLQLAFESVLAADQDKWTAEGACVTMMPFEKTREIVEVLVKVAPSIPVFIVADSAENKNFVGVAYVPKNFQSFTSEQWADHVCSATQGFHSLPKGKHSKHTNIQVFSLPSGNDDGRDLKFVTDLARMFDTSRYKLKGNNNANSESISEKKL